MTNKKEDLKGMKIDNLPLVTYASDFPEHEAEVFNGYLNTAASSKGAIVTIKTTDLEVYVIARHYKFQYEEAEE